MYWPTQQNKPAAESSNRIPIHACSASKCTRPDSNDVLADSAAQARSGEQQPHTNTCPTIPNIAMAMFYHDHDDCDYDHNSASFTTRDCGKLKTKES